MRPINEDWLIDHDPDESLRVIAASVGRLHDRSIHSPVAGVLVITHRSQPWPWTVVFLLLAIPTAGLSLIAFLFAKSAYHVTVRAEPDDDGTRLSVEGRANQRTVGAIMTGLGIADPA